MAWQPRRKPLSLLRTRKEGRDTLRCCCWLMRMFCVVGRHKMKSSIFSLFIGVIKIFSSQTAGCEDVATVASSSSCSGGRCRRRRERIFRYVYTYTKERCVDHQHCHRVIQHSGIIVAINMNIVLVHTVPHASSSGGWMIL